MYERFTDRARKVLQLANQEAIRRNHEFVGPEHILVGIAREGGGLACEVLKAKQVRLKTILDEVGRLVHDGPDVNFVSLIPRAMTPRARKIMECAMLVARGLGHGYVGTEHLLLALVRETETVAWKILTEAGLTYEAVLGGIQAILESCQPASGQVGDAGQLLIECRNVVAAMPAMILAISTAAKEMGPQDLAAPITLKPETAAMVMKAWLALEGKPATP